MPLKDSVTLTIQRVNSTVIETITVRIVSWFPPPAWLTDEVQLPYRSRLGSTAVKWTNSASFRAKNCKATLSTVGYDLYGSLPFGSQSSPSPAVQPSRKTPSISAEESRKHKLNVALDVIPQQSHTLPKRLVPQSPIAPNSNGGIEFYMLNDGKTGVLALGSFASTTFSTMQTSLLTGLKQLKSGGATQLIVDVVSRNSQSSQVYKAE